jgi:hypothetical protein
MGGLSRNILVVQSRSSSVSSRNPSTPRFSQKRDNVEKLVLHVGVMEVEVGLFEARKLCR